LEKENGRLVFKNHTIKLDVPPCVTGAELSGREVSLGIRPDDVYVARNEDRNCSDEIGATLEVSELLGHRENLYLKAGDTRILAIAEAFFNQSPGSRVPIWFNLDNMHIFDRNTGRRI